MLNGIDPRFTPELLYCLARMGHGDELVIADANFPCDATAAHTFFDQTIRLTAQNAPQAIELVTQLLPLDPYFDHAALRMEIDGAPEDMGEVHTEAWELLTPRLPDGAKLGHIERQDFYARARHAFAVVQTAESRPFGCFILRKGVIF